MLKSSNIDAFYGSAHILHGVSLQVGNGERVAIVGRNGAGKSTLLKSLMNAGPRVSGDILLDDKTLAQMPEFRRARSGMAFVPEDRRILTHITVFENLQLAARAMPTANNPRDPEEVLNKFEMLIPLRNRLAGRLSGGQQQMLAVARALVARPRLMLLDEPTEGLAPVIVQALADEVVESCRDSGAALLLCEQNLWFARKCTDRMYIIDSGKIVFDGAWEEFDRRKDELVRYISV